VEWIKNLTGGQPMSTFVSMDTFIAFGLFIAGLAMVLGLAEQLVKGVVGTSLNFGISPFMISVIFIGFDPDNLSVGAVASYEGALGIAWGSIIGAAMVAIAFAFGVSALFAPMKFDKVPGQILAVSIGAVVLVGILGFDGQLSRTDGIILLSAFVLSLVWLLRLSRQGLDLKPTGEVAETLGKRRKPSKAKSLALLIGSLVGIVIGSELLVRSSKHIITMLGLSESVFGMTILAFLVSIEELARTLPAALKGRPDISFGNVVGSILAMFLFNGGVIALVNPITMNCQVLSFYLPYALATVVIISLIMMTRNVSRWAGAVLVLIYFGFVAGSYVVQ
jgi:cation:H+ antiporter